MPEQGVKVCFVDTPGANEALDGALNGTQIELIEPLDASSPIHGFLEKNPQGGQHHVCFEVADIDEAPSGSRGGASASSAPRASARTGRRSFSSTRRT